MLKLARCFITFALRHAGYFGIPQPLLTPLTSPRPLAPNLSSSKEAWASLEFQKHSRVKYLSRALYLVSGDPGMGNLDVPDPSQGFDDPKRV